MSSYLPTIGIECHVQLKTKTKLFAAVGNDARDVSPNSLVSHICLGMPGALPVLNKKAVELAIRAAFALGTEPEKFSKFDRKHYFYPDLPKGYQISQFNHPIIAGGQVKIIVDGEEKVIGVTRAHLEEDAGKNTHPNGKDFSLVDLNRAGTPLLEIVSEPDIHSAKEARAYARELYLIMKYAEVSDANLYYGNMRFDVNVSVSKDKKLGNRTETKNLNSFRAVEKTVEYEIKRQTELLESGKSVAQETRGWDESKQKTFSQRTKEEAHDYRYFPDPDIPPVVLDQAMIETVRSEMPESPDELRKNLAKLSLDSSAVETLVEEMVAGRVIQEIASSEVDSEHIKRISLWLAVDVQGMVASEEGKGWDDLEIDPNSLIKLSKMVEASKLSSTGAKAVLKVLIEKGESSPEDIANDLKVLQVSDEGQIASIVDKVISDNPKAAEDIKNGEMKAIGFLVGQIMKESKGQANPGLAQKLIKERLG